MVRGVAFDFDGTLVDSNEIKRRAYYEAAADLDPEGRAVAAVLARAKGGTRHHVMRALAAELGQPDSAAEELERRYTGICLREVSACPEIPGAERALRALGARGLPLYLNTATPRDAVLPILRRRGWEALFRGVYGAPGDKVEHLGAMAAELAAGPGELVLVGDGEDDRRAAAEFGCVFVAVALPGRPGRFRQAPGCCIPDLVTLPDRLEELARAPR